MLRETFETETIQLDGKDTYPISKTEIGKILTKRPCPVCNGDNPLCRTCADYGK